MFVSSFLTIICLLAANLTDKCTMVIFWIIYFVKMFPNKVSDKKPAHWI